MSISISRKASLSELIQSSPFKSIQSSVLALTSVLLAWSGTMLLNSFGSSRLFLIVLFLVAIAICAGLGGLRTGILATLLSVLTCNYFFLPPIYSFRVLPAEAPLLILFIIVALLINILSILLRNRVQHADQRFYQLVQGLDGIVWEANPKTQQFTFVSQRAEAMLGYAVRQWRSHPDFRTCITHQEDQATVRTLLQRAIREGGEHTEDYRVLTASGQEVWLRETIYVVHDANRRPIRMMGLGIDITDRKIAAEELLRLKDEFAILNTITAAVSASLELPDFLKSLQNQLNEHLDISAGCIFLVDETITDEAGEYFRLTDIWGVPASLVSEWSMCSDTQFAISTKRGEPSTPYMVTQIPLTGGLQKLGYSDALAIPLLAKDELRGGLYLFIRNSLTNKSVCLSSHSTFFATLGRQIGTLLQNVTLFREVHAGRERLSQLSRQMAEIQEAERRVIARELHDEVGQVLTGLKLSLEMCVRLPPDVIVEHIQNTLPLISELMSQVEALSLNLRPTMLDDLGLLTALQWHCKRYTQLTNISVCLEHTGLDRRFPNLIESTAYRIVQEALTNVARHANTNTVTVRLWATRSLVGIQIVDNGCGFDLTTTATNKASGGLIGMQERTRLLNGYWHVETAPGMGTSISVNLPLNAPKGYREGWSGSCLS